MLVLWDYKIEEVSKGANLLPNVILKFLHLKGQGRDRLRKAKKDI